VHGHLGLSHGPGRIFESAGILFRPAARHPSYSSCSRCKDPRTDTRPRHGGSMPWPGITYPAPQLDETCVQGESLRFRRWFPSCPQLPYWFPRQSEDAPHKALLGENCVKMRFPIPTHRPSESLPGVASPTSISAEHYLRQQRIHADWHANSCQS
jgi:hypothetical protein